MQSTWQGALHVLADGIQQLHNNACASAAPSGSIRLEVEFPATFTSLEWLLAHSPRANPADTSHDSSGAATAPPVATAQKCLQVYFSPRHSPQPAADAVCSPTVAGTFRWTPTFRYVLGRRHVRAGVRPTCLQCGCWERVVVKFELHLVLLPG